MPSKPFTARRDQLVRGAVARIWPLFQKAPSPFTGYKAAEKYLPQRLASQQFDYAIDANATTEHVWNVKNRVHHEFTREAERAGLFIIDRHPQEVMADAMAGATPHHIQVVSMNNTQLLETMISEWPNSFADLTEARHWARQIYRQNGLASNLCVGKAPSDARNQAVNCAVLNAYNAGKFAVDIRPAMSSAYMPQKEEEKLLLSSEGRSEDQISLPNSIRSSSPATSDVDQDDELPQTPGLATISKRKGVQTITLSFKNVIELDEAYMAARFEMAEQMLSRIGLHPADKKAREMEDEIANAEENLAKTGIEVSRKKKAFLE